jgi:hypothetical protein
VLKIAPDCLQKTHPRQRHRTSVWNLSGLWRRRACRFLIPPNLVTCRAVRLTLSQFWDAAEFLLHRIPGIRSSQTWSAIPRRYIISLPYLLASMQSFISGIRYPNQSWKRRNQTAIMDRTITQPYRDVFLATSIPISGWLQADFRAYSSSWIPNTGLTACDKPRWRSRP